MKATEQTRREAVRPGTLARWTLNDVGHDGSRIDMRHVLDHFDLDLEVVRELPRASSLRVRNERLVVQVRNTDHVLQRFNIAHEVGHYLLAAKIGVTFREQTQDPSFESYCNSYASNLLIPRRWLYDATLGFEASLSGAIVVADETETSLMSAVIALNDACDWNTVCVMWQRFGDRGWSPTRTVGDLRCGLLESADETDSFLQSVGGNTVRLTLPVRVTGRPCWVQAEVIRMGNRCFSMFDGRTLSTSDA